jgi:hypothetical protein
MNREIDVRDVLPTVGVPTLVMHGSEDTVVPVQVGVYTAERLGSARFAEVPGVGHLALRAGAAQIQMELERFLTDVWQTGAWDDTEPDRVLATVLFTDIVSSTEKAIELGDRRWRELLGRHNELVRRELLRYRGREVDTTGDGFLAVFDGPARAIRCAAAIVDGVHELGLTIRTGLHTGECELVEGSVAGIAVHTGARVGRASSRRRGTRVEPRPGSRRWIRHRVRTARHTSTEGHSRRMEALRCTASQTPLAVELMI